MIAESAVRIPLGEALRVGDAAWDNAMRRAGATSPFMSWAWHDAWLATAPAADRDRASVVRAGDDIVPLDVRPVTFRRQEVRALSWTIDDTGCPDYLDAALTGGNAGAVEALLEPGWDLAVLPGVVAGAPGVQQLARAFEQRGLVVRRQHQWACPYVDLPGDWNTLLASLPATRRQSLRRKERTLRRDFAYQLREYTGADRAEGLRRLLALHASRWPGGGAFGDPRLVRLHERFAEWLDARGLLWLFTLDLDGESAAAWYGFAWGDTVYFYQSGRDPRHAARSVGRVLMGEMIRRAIERGFRRLDLLRGQETYKTQWTPLAHPCESWTIFRRSGRGQVMRALDWLARSTQRWRGVTASAGAGDPESE